MHTPFKKTIKVVQDDLDELSHVNNVRYVQWIQDIAKAHWFHSIEGKVTNTYIWVVASHFIEYKRSAVLNDKISMETYVEKFSKSMSHRVVEIRNAENQKLYVRALTKWCLVDIKTMKPMKIPDEILNLD